MHHIDIKSLDLNLLVALEELLRHRNVSRAAEALGRSQSTVSHTLARLRVVFDDALLVPGRRGMVITPKAESLEAPVRHALRQVRAIWEEDSSFSPQSTKRTMAVASVDALGALLPQLMSWLGREAPGVTLQVKPRTLVDPVSALSSGEIDILIEIAVEPRRELRQKPIGEVRWLSYVREGHPLLDGEVDLERWLDVPSIRIVTGTPSRSLVDRAVESTGATRRIGAELSGFLLALHSIKDSDLILTAPHILAPLAGELGLRHLHPPLPLPGLPVSLIWHERHQRDPAYRWFRDGLLDHLLRAWSRADEIMEPTPTESSAR